MYAFQVMGVPMTPRERVLTALDHRAPDRTPRSFWAEAPTWQRLFAHVGHDDKARLLDELGIDVRQLELDGPPERHVGDGLYQNFWGERFVYRQTPWGRMRADTDGALAGAQSLGELETFDWPTPDLFDYESLDAACEQLDEYAILYGFADVWQRPGLVRGWEGMFMDMALRPEWAHFLSRTFTDFYKEDCTRAAESTNGRIDIYLLISDLGSQHGPLMSVEMSPEQLKAEFGDVLSFHGGIDMQHLLPYGNAEDVRAEVSRYCDVLGRDGGYILGPAHVFQPDVSPENIFAVYEKE